jgi:hypothetical protein
MTAMQVAIHAELTAARTSRWIAEPTLDMLPNSGNDAVPQAQGS